MNAILNTTDRGSEPHSKGVLAFHLSVYHSSACPYCPSPVLELSWTNPDYAVYHPVLISSFDKQGGPNTSTSYMGRDASEPACTSALDGVLLSLTPLNPKNSLASIYFFLVEEWTLFLFHMSPVPIFMLRIRKMYRIFYMLSEIQCIKSVAPYQRLHMVAINFCHSGEEPNSNAQCACWKNTPGSILKINFKIVFSYNLSLVLKCHVELGKYLP